MSQSRGLLQRGWSLSHRCETTTREIDRVHSLTSSKSARGSGCLCGILFATTRVSISLGSLRYTIWADNLIAPSTCYLCLYNRKVVQSALRQVIVTLQSGVGTLIFVPNTASSDSNGISQTISSPSNRKKGWGSTSNVKYKSPICSVKGLR